MYLWLNYITLVSTTKTKLNSLGESISFVFYSSNLSQRFSFHLGKRNILTSRVTNTENTSDTNQLLYWWTGLNSASHLLSSDKKGQVSLSSLPLLSKLSEISLLHSHGRYSWCQFYNLRICDLADLWVQREISISLKKRWKQGVLEDNFKIEKSKDVSDFERNMHIEENLSFGMLMDKVLFLCH